MDIKSVMVKKTDPDELRSYGWGYNGEVPRYVEASQKLWDEWRERYIKDGSKV